MKDFSVLMTCSSIHVNDMVECLKNNEDGANVKVYATNSVAWDLPSDDVCDGGFVVPMVSDPAYIEELKRLCLTKCIDVLLPTATIELGAIAEHKSEFEELGVRVSVSSPESIALANDKIALSERYAELMPEQAIVRNSAEAASFLSRTKGRVCCKLPDLCGGKGFAVVDDEKCDDILLFHRFGKKHFISSAQLGRVVDKYGGDVILQEYHEGEDYTVSVLADHGKVLRAFGYVGHVLEFGSIMYGEMRAVGAAYDISAKIVGDLGLDGNVGVDFILEHGGGVKLLEVNPRINASLPFVAAAGCNMLYLRCKSLLGYGIDGEGLAINHNLKMKKYFGTRYFV